MGHMAFLTRSVMESPIPHLWPHGPGYDPRFNLPRGIVDVNGVSLAVSDQGPKDAAHTLVFMHGLAGNMTHWIHVAPRFLTGNWKNRVRVVTLDFRGCGASSRKGPFSIATYANDVVALSRALGIEQATFIGHSLGGMVACALASRAPHLVERLVLVNPGGLRCVPRILRGLGRAVLSKHLLSQVLPVVWLKVLGMVFERDNHHTADFIRYTNESFPVLDRQRDVGDIARVISDLKHDFLHTDLSQDLHAIERPIGLIFGEQDRLVPAESMRQLARHLPHVILEEIEQCGHMPNIEVPDRVVKFIENLIAPT